MKYWIKKPKQINKKTTRNPRKENPLKQIKSQRQGTIELILIIQSIKRKVKKPGNFFFWEIKKDSNSIRKILAKTNI